METLEVIGRLILMLMILGSAVLIVYINIKENPYENETSNEIRNPDRD